MSKNDDDYEVGYRKPPKRTQFKKGQSGNPKGRKKGARGLKTDLLAVLNERVEVTENGKTIKLTKQQIVVKQLVAKASKGDVRAIGKLAELIVAFGLEDEVRKEVTTLPAENKAILDAYLARHLERRDDN